MSLPLLRFKQSTKLTLYQLYLSSGCCVHIIWFLVVFSCNQEQNNGFLFVKEGSRVLSNRSNRFVVIVLGTQCEGSTARWWGQGPPGKLMRFWQARKVEPETFKHSLLRCFEWSDWKFPFVFCFHTPGCGVRLSKLFRTLILEACIQTRHSGNHTRHGRTQTNGPATTPEHVPWYSR